MGIKIPIPFGLVGQIAAKALRSVIGKAAVAIAGAGAVAVGAGAAGVIPAGFNPEVIRAYAELATAIGTALAVIVAAFHHQQDVAAGK